MCVFHLSVFHKKGKTNVVLIDKCLEINEILLNRTGTQLVFYWPNSNLYLNFDKKFLSYDPWKYHILMLKDLLRAIRCNSWKGLLVVLEEGKYICLKLLFIISLTKRKKWINTYIHTYIEQTQALYQNLNNNERIGQDYGLIPALCDGFASKGANCRQAERKDWQEPNIVNCQIELKYITREVEKRHLLAEDIMWAQDNMLIGGSWAEPQEID